MSQGDLHLHVRGESIYVDDLVVPQGALYAAVLGSPVAHGTIERLDCSRALRRAQVVRVMTAADVPGENQIGPILPDEPLLAEGRVDHVGQPVAVVLATSERAARQALEDIELQIAPLPAVFSAREAAARGRLLVPARTFALGDVDRVWPACTLVVAGRAATGAQEHFYLETQGALAVPAEDGTIRLHSSTQSPTGVQKQAARVLGVPMHAVEVDVRRLGGAFGGKEDQATVWAVICALGARLTGRAVKLMLGRAEDLVMTGKRHPYEADFKLGLDADGRFLAYAVTLYQNAGSAADLSTAVLERSLFHATGSYAVANVRATGLSCRTNLPPFTAFRGFGGPQGMFVIEAAIDLAARRLGLPRHELQRRNLLRADTILPYGMAAENCRAAACWDAVDREHGIANVVAAAAAHNREHHATKRGVAVMPVCFGISFTNTTLNQAGALVHVYNDGSVGLSTGAVEMGQGVGLKLRRIAAETLGISLDRVRLQSTNTTRVANTSPTAASTGADLNGGATRQACLQILERLRAAAAAQLGRSDCGRLSLEDERVCEDGRPTRLGWDDLVQAAYLARINLSAHAHYATPRIGFDRTTEKGRPFAYHVYGTALVAVTLDVLRGTVTVDRVSLVHDGGRSLDPATDVGQVEGGLVQGLGWMLLEDVAYDAQGRLRHDTAGKYKVPDIQFAPAELNFAFLPDAGNPEAVLASKAIGEPPFMYGIGAYFATLAAVRAAGGDERQPAAADSPGDCPGDYITPLTPERIMSLLTGCRRKAPESAKPEESAS